MELTYLGIVLCLLLLAIPACLLFVYDEQLLARGTVAMVRMLAQVADIWDARIQVMDADCRIINDSYKVDKGRYNVSEQVMSCLSAKSVVTYADREELLSIIAYPMVRAEGTERTVEGISMTLTDTFTPPMAMEQITYMLKSEL